MPTARGLIRWYYAAREDIGAPSLDPVKSRGRVYARRCGAERRLPGRGRVRCQSTIRHATRSGGYACGRCGAAWPYVERFELRGEVQESIRRTGSEDARAAWVDVGVALERLFREHGWAGRLYVANVLGHPIRELAREGPRAWPDANVPWSTGSVWGRVKAGEQAWGRVLAAVGIEVDPY